jgi:alpha-beta hydrolase superfamily lysophospholipase
MKPNTHNIKFTSMGFTLTGVLHLPDTINPPLVVGSHGLEGSKDSAKQRILSKILAENGIAFFRFDHRGCGESQGDFTKETSLEKRTEDFIHAVTHIMSLGKTSHELAIFGSSMGGATCINSWHQLQKLSVNLCGAVLCSAPVKSLTIKNIPTDASDKRPALPLEFFKENLLFNLMDKATDLSQILIFHGDADDIVPVSNAHDIYKMATDPKQLIIHRGGDHQMSSKKDQVDFESKAVAWFLKCFN